MRLSFRGRRSQGGFSLNSLDYVVFGASKYEVNMFLSLTGAQNLSWVSRSSKKSIFILAFQWLYKAIQYFLVILKIANKEFLFLIAFKFSAVLLDF